MVPCDQELNPNPFLTLPFTCKPQAWGCIVHTLRHWVAGTLYYNGMLTSAPVVPTLCSGSGTPQLSQNTPRLPCFTGQTSHQKPLLDSTVVSSGLAHFAHPLLHSVVVPFKDLEIHNLEWRCREHRNVEGHCHWGSALQHSVSSSNH
jgi:hypothetical protein